MRLVLPPFVVLVLLLAAGGPGRGQEEKAADKPVVVDLADFPFPGDPRQADRWKAAAEKYDGKRVVLTAPVGALLRQADGVTTWRVAGELRLRGEVFHRDVSFQLRDVPADDLRDVIADRRPVTVTGTARVVREPRFGWCLITADKLEGLPAARRRPDAR